MSRVASGSRKSPEVKEALLEELQTVGVLNDGSKIMYALGLRVDPAPHVLEREQCVVGASKPARDRTNEGLPPRALVVAAHDGRFHVMSKVRAPYAFMTVVRPNCVVVGVRRS